MTKIDDFRKDNLKNEDKLKKEDVILFTKGVIESLEHEKAPPQSFALSTRDPTWRASWHTVNIKAGKNEVLGKRNCFNLNR